MIHAWVACKEHVFVFSLVSWPQWRPHTSAALLCGCLQVLDYQNVANTLLPLVANAYAMHFMGEEMMGGLSSSNSTCLSHGMTSSGGLQTPVLNLQPARRSP